MRKISEEDKRNYQRAEEAEYREQVAYFEKGIW
jgi:hypothetical protein